MHKNEKKFSKKKESKLTLKHHSQVSDQGHKHKIVLQKLDESTNNN